MNLHKHSQRSLRHPCKRCGERDGLYWAHDLDNPNGNPCGDCQVNGKFMLVQAVNGDPRTFKVHDCQQRYDVSIREHVWTATDRPVETPKVEAAPEPSDVPAPVETPAPAPAPKATANGAGDRLEMLNALLEMMAPKVDESQVRDILRQENGALIKDLKDEISAALTGIEVPTRIEVTLPDGDVAKIGTCHRDLPSIIQVAKFRHVLMVGPAGTGKSHIPAQVAEAYGVPYFEMSVNPQMTKTDLLGYKDANGVYHPTLFREWYENGGVFHFDEIDAGLPGIVMTINGALAQPQIAFPDGMVQRSDKFMRAIASANTFGRGADRVYQGRQPLDQSTLNRFAVMPITYDNAFEHSLCEATGAPAHLITEVLRYVRAIRDRIERESMPVIVSMRDSMGLCELVNDGVPAGDAVTWMVRRGLSDSDWAKVTLGVSDLSL